MRWVGMKMGKSRKQERIVGVLDHHGGHYFEAEQADAVREGREHGWERGRAWRFSFAAHARVGSETHPPWVNGRHDR